MVERKSVLVTTHPFGLYDGTPIRLLKDAGITFDLNPKGRRLSQAEIEELAPHYEVIIAGTEIISAEAIRNSDSLQLIARVGIGLDSVDLLEARKKGVQVAYTPDAPAPAVAELTLGLMFSLCRGIHIANQQIREGNWYRITGRRLQELTVGIIGCGRIGSRVGRFLSSIGAQLLISDKKGREFVGDQMRLCANWKYGEIEDVIRAADILTLHVPRDCDSTDMIDADSFRVMKKNASIINTARGGIINEADLYDALVNQVIDSAAIDVFEDEPYEGPLKTLNNCLLTSHMGSMTEDCRAQMEIEATEDVIRYLSNTALKRPVPEEEYSLRSRQDET